MNLKQITVYAGSALILASIFGCASMKEPPSSQEMVKLSLSEQTEIAERWKNSLTKVDRVENGWIRSFKDPALEALIDEVIQNNLSLQVVSANLTAASNMAVQAGALLAPAVSVGAGGGASQRGNLDTRTAGASLNVKWEADVWGKLSSSAAAAEEAFRATEADYDFARQSLAAQTAKAWFFSIELYLQKSLAEEAVQVYEHYVQIVSQQHDVGKAQPQDLNLVRADKASAEERLRQAQGAYEQGVRSLEVMLGRYPSADLEVARKFVPVPPAIPVGVPSGLLERRPDITAAERRVASAFHRIQAAKAAKLPSIGLTASGGRTSSELISLVGAQKNFFSVGANLLAPIDIGGGLEAQVQIETAGQEAALAAYGQTALRAFAEVETGLSNELLLVQRQTFLQSVLFENMTALKISKLKYEVGQIDLLSVLQMQLRVLNARIALIHIQNVRLAQRVDLHLALGGSFE